MLSARVWEMRQLPAASDQAAPVCWAESMMWTMVFVVASGCGWMMTGASGFSACKRSMLARTERMSTLR